MKLKPWMMVVAGGLVASAIALAQGSGTLVYNSNASDPEPKKFDQKIVELFRQKNPGINVTHNTVDHESFKQAIRTYLASDNPPDVLTWFAGNRMRFFSSKGLAADISDVWQKEGWTKTFPKGFQALSQDEGKFVFVPTSYYWWAMYYRKDIFAKLGLKEAKTWNEFLGLCDKLNAAGITPIATGSKFLWPLGGWFDFLNMRVNGPKFHIDLTDGKIPYTDRRVRAVFTYWKQLLDRKCFIQNSASYDWHEAAAVMTQGKAAMYLMGDFIRDQWKDGLEKTQLDFFRFPIIDPRQPVGEEAPTDGYFVSAKAKNIDNAKSFLGFLGSKEVMELGAKELGRLVPRGDVDAKLYADKPQIAKAQKNIIGPADAIAQFYDRDTDPEMANIGMKGFQRFMSEPDKLNEILNELETARKRIFSGN
jgi:multiple sugar transport system substrate-binding protein/raffinose/stachyose/melibiose transport system substrate-binding protein